ncbi:MAG: PilZ domain-containing protein [Methylococcaceae bacterium]|nr:PilZ domain-containing protein [Methylococcaceae bacterium]MDZ4157825.1 PilZ domain-containing protein [Methylococcales bacterium]MDP2392330.1 PilZ domain-containing protein [Methylococcaceae bacterium]MDP3021224.1 PilZ domain-containing protein [Methylococcaceae bacterium]MDP3389775.1 PilZ domain-containing protein [Methylococcaceae bacterium]
MQNIATERRRFFRVDDTISLSYRLIDEATVNSGLNALMSQMSAEFSLAASLDVLSQQAALFIQRLESQNPEMMALYKILDGKINAIAQATMIIGSDVNPKNYQDVNLSATGLAFYQSSPLQIGQHLAIEIFLPTTVALILAYSKVINCQQIEPDRFLISLDYTHIREDDQELLIKHVLRKQWQIRQDQATAPNY